MLVDFYHLTAAPLERVLPRICERLLEERQRLLIVADGQRLAELDSQLWGFARDAFLPHGLASDDGAANQPILLAATADAPNGARNVALADGRWRDEALAFDRVFYFFDSAAIEDARKNWAALKGREGVERRYWKQTEAGKWVQGP